MNTQQGNLSVRLLVIKVETVAPERAGWHSLCSFSHATLLFISTTNPRTGSFTLRPCKAIQLMSHCPTGPATYLVLFHLSDLPSLPITISPSVILFHFSMICSCGHLALIDDSDSLAAPTTNQPLLPSLPFSKTWHSPSVKETELSSQVEGGSHIISERCG